MFVEIKGVDMELALRFISPEGKSHKDQVVTASNPSKPLLT